MRRGHDRTGGAGAVEYIGVDMQRSTSCDEEAIGALDFNRGVHAAVDAVELVEEEVGEVQGEVL